jgi:hypothetical protein
MKISQMFSEGKISIEEAEELLGALEDSQSEETTASRKRGWLRIRVVEKGKEAAKINIPLSLVRFGMRFIPSRARKQMLEKGVNPEDIFREIEAGTVGKLVEVEQGSDQVEVWVE